MKKKSLSERYADDILTDNTKIVMYSQCKNCKYRDGRGTSWDYHGYQKGICKKWDGKVDGTGYKPKMLNDYHNPDWEKCFMYREDTEIPNTCKSPFDK